MVAVEIVDPETMELGERHELFATPLMARERGTRPFVVAPDGRFLLLMQPRAGGGGVIQVDNFFEELKSMAR